MAAVVEVAAVLVASYLIGAIPFAVIVGRVFYRTDVRELGSGNTGATNVLRVLGPKAGIAVLLLDMLKGVAAAALALAWASAASMPEARDWVLIGASFAAVLGHSYSPFLRFRGGKGVATAAGALLLVTPLVWPIVLAVFIAVVAFTRMASLGSVTIAAIFPALVFVFYGDRTALVIFSAVAASLVIWRHRANIGRIVRGEEPTIAFRDRRGGDREDSR
ncbi:MAG TPA: glycerol-3-phosphate 1-O-acyltransferase PlsY [Coriobacteriia bacterium]|nr:glycerol-3-phosphate 1-O-acyltransferase PlsY [Coriobacteriia bacterium]